MLRVEVNKRISIGEALKHAWFASYLIKKQPTMDQINEYYRNIVNFKTDQKFFFQHATLAFMVHHIVKKEQTDGIRKMFISLDQKGDGKLTYSEIINGFKKCNNFNEKELLKILKFIDYSKTGTIEFEEFIRACINKNELLTDENLKTTFQLFTKDETKDHLSPSEFKSLLGLNSKFSDSTWDQIIKTIDKDGNNQIEYDEFKEMMLED